ncbi:glycoside hydrolase family 15 protein (plasmid) [Hymenobacter tibetensis]|uniref:Glycoside hydrolase family 15 protein n=1 Tax=Hymenobacter tibetensis TaxID=497967 RepID=A0ABY4DB77_9BACT|nr:glycoside hydrolase family 15 protein [Hymenobacter tibetensis]UOG77363.1 glycoside hydrolase family 15 protein [Hymenobacter tibetensis]
MRKQPAIHSLAVVSDRRTCALLDKQGTMCWYCPQRFDSSAVLSVLLDAEQGGYWTVAGSDKHFISRTYVERSSVLTTEFTVAGQPFSLTDWMPLNEDFAGLCRQFSVAPAPLTVTLRLRAEYGLQATAVELDSAATTAHFPELGLWLKASHPLQQVADTLVCTIPAGAAGWAVLTETAAAVPELSTARLEASRQHTLHGWRQLAALLPYEGLYEQAVVDSIRAVQQLTYQETGGIVAAATTSLPEVPGGQRNYDYRYVWMRDVSLIVSALLQLDAVGQPEKSFLEFLAQARRENQQVQLTPFYAVDKTRPADLHEIALAGYDHSRPVQIGNTASNQLQLDAHANVLLAAKLLYDRFNEKKEWEMVAQVADFLAENWARDDNGIWEEGATKPYTSSKVLAARGLEFIADYADSAAQAQRWRQAAAAIRAYVNQHCLTESGAYAVYAGSQEVDITAVQFPLWTYCAPDSPEMLATVREIEQHWSHDNLYWRRLEEFDAHQEGAFLAGTCWMAHYYAVAGQLDKTQQILEAVLQYQNDLGFFAEEAGVDSGEQMLGNFPQTFVHSSFICAVNGLKQELAGQDSRVHAHHSSRPEETPDVPAAGSHPNEH